MLTTNIECNYRNLKGFKTLERISYEQNNLVDKKAEKRLKILLFWEKHGLEATKEAYEVSERTLYNWKKKYKDGGNKTYSLSDKSKSPKQKRKRKWDYKILEEIIKIRAKYPNLGKEKGYEPIKVE